MIECFTEHVLPKLLLVFLHLWHKATRLHPHFGRSPWPHRGAAGVLNTSPAQPLKSLDGADGFINVLEAFQEDTPKVNEDGTASATFTRQQLQEDFYQDFHYYTDVVLTLFPWFSLFWGTKSGEELWQNTLGSRPCSSARDTQIEDPNFNKQTQR